MIFTMLPEVLSAYPAVLRALTWTPLGNAGGLSGANLYRGDGATGPLMALKIWPHDWDTTQLARMNDWMRTARKQGCEFVPRILPPTNYGVTHRVNVMEWVPGEPAASPNELQFQAIGAALARLHQVHELPVVGPVPAVQRRLSALASLSSAWRELGTQAQAWLDPWRNLHDSLVMTHGDLRVDHVLFLGDQLSGLIDFGAVKIDHPAADLARYVADIGPASVAPLCQIYESAGGNLVNRDFVRALAFSGLVVAAARWAGLPGAVAAARSRERLDKLAAWRG